jgi:hypothetical protein
MLTVEGASQFPGIVRKYFSAKYELKIWQRFTITWIMVLFLCTIFIYYPKAGLMIYNNHRGVNQDVYAFTEQNNINNAIVFISAEDSLFYGPGFIANDPDLEHGAVIYARDLGQTENENLVRLYPERQVYYYTYVKKENSVKRLVKNVLSH